LKLNGEQIIRLAEVHLEGDKIDNNSFAAAVINECQQLDLGADAGVSGSTTTTVTDATEDTWIAFPTTGTTTVPIEVYEITKDGDMYFGSQYGEFYDGSFDQKPGFIRFPEDGAYIVNYWARPADYTEVRATPQANVALHPAMAYYLAARYKLNEDEDSESADKLMAQYQILKQAALEQIQTPSSYLRAPFVATAEW
jgi:hypothetical protein